MTLPGPRCSPIGLDVGDRWIKAIQLRRASASRPWRIAARARFRRGEDELTAGEVDRIEQVVHRRGFTPAGLVLAAPPRSLTCATITLPPASSGAPLDQIARAELARIARRDPAAVQVGWWPVPAPAGGRQHESTHAMAAACARAEIEDLIARFAAARLEVEAVDSPAWALARATRELHRAEGARPELCAVLDLGHSLASLVVLRDGVPVYERSLEDLGVATLEQELRKSHGLSEELTAHMIERVGAPLSPVPAGPGPAAADLPADDEHIRAVADYLARVAREVAASIAYLAHRYPAWPVDALVCAGGGAAIPGAPERLAEHTGLTVRAASLGELSEGSEEGAGPGSAGDAPMFLAAGLALYAPEDPQ